MKVKIKETMSEEINPESPGYREYPKEDHEGGPCETEEEYNALMKKIEDANREYVARGLNALSEI